MVSLKYIGATLNAPGIGMCVYVIIIIFIEEVINFRGSRVERWEELEGEREG